MQRLLKTQVVLPLIWAILSAIAIGQVPQLINYKGALTDPGTGQSVPDDIYTIAFSIYDVSSGGSDMRTEI